MPAQCRTDLEKALEVLLYVARCVPDTYAALKMIYFADKQHLATCGRLIYGDRYIAMAHGPVPSAAYDLVKDARGDGVLPMPVPTEGAFGVEGTDIVPRRSPDTDLLSESEIECLDDAIRRYGAMSFDQLRQESHDSAFRNAGRNDEMPIEELARSLPDSEALLEYLEIE